MRLLVCVLVLLVVAAAAYGEHADDLLVPSPSILSQLVAAAERYGDPFRPEIRHEDGKPYAYYLKEATYVGSTRASFGGVHVASFFFLRSGTTSPARGHSFVAFYDQSLRLRRYWSLDSPMQGWRLRFDGSALLLDEKPLFDFARGDKDERIVIDRGEPRLVVDGKPQRAPIW